MLLHTRQTHIDHAVRSGIFYRIVGQKGKQLLKRGRIAADCYIRLRLTFNGNAMLKRKDQADLPVRIGLELEGKRPAREGCAIQLNGKNIGTVTSGQTAAATFSATHVGSGTVTAAGSGFSDVTGTIDVAAAIIAESTLSFLGLGFPPDIPTWGRLLFDAKDYLDIAPHWALFAGAAIFLTVLAINFIGDGLRDALDPRKVM